MIVTCPSSLNYEPDHSLRKYFHLKLQETLLIQTFVIKHYRYMRIFWQQIDRKQKFMTSQAGFSVLSISYPIYVSSYICKIFIYVNWKCWLFAEAYSGICPGGRAENPQKTVYALIPEGGGDWAHIDLPLNTPLVICLKINVNTYQGCLWVLQISFILESLVSWFHKPASWFQRFF